MKYFLFSRQLVSVKPRGYRKTIIFTDIVLLESVFWRSKFNVSAKCPKFLSEICPKWDWVSENLSSETKRPNIFTRSYEPVYAFVTPITRLSYPFLKG